MFCSGLTSRSYESLKILCCLTRAESPMRAHQIAAMTGLPPAQTAKILQQIARAGFVHSRRGAMGGFWLSRPAEQIHVADVISSLNEHPAFQPAEHEDDAVVSVLARAFERCRRAFGRLTIAHLEEAARKSVRGRVSRSSPRDTKRQSTPAPQFVKPPKTR